MNEVRTQWLTVAVLVGLVVEVILLDVLLARTFGVSATFSRTSAWLFERWPILYPIFVFAVGVLVGHIGLPQYIRPR
jgi:hypothetical protein